VVLVGEVVAVHERPPAWCRVSAPNPAQAGVFEVAA
jgi:hypothetical protein